MKKNKKGFFMKHHVLLAIRATTAMSTIPVEVCSS